MSNYNDRDTKELAQRAINSDLLYNEYTNSKWPKNSEWSTFKGSRTPEISHKYDIDYVLDLCSIFSDEETTSNRCRKR